MLVADLYRESLSVGDEGQVSKGDLVSVLGVPGSRSGPSGVPISTNPTS